MIVQSLLKISLLGATWVLYLLLFLSVVSIGAALERFLFFRKNRSAGKALDDALGKALRKNDYGSAARALAASPSLEASILREALEWKKGGPEAVNDALESAIGRHRADLDRGATLLGTLGNNAPFVGLFGTIIGVIEAFSHLGNSAEGGGMAKVMGGIAEALIATGVGIFVAIPAVVAYNVFQKRSEEIETHVQSLARLFTAWLHTYPEARDAEDGAAAGRLEGSKQEREESGENQLARVSVGDGAV
ncbi:MAG: MotA/TolQ/ExbB proton channel family protein [Myxococcaceae bacterium]|nr:MotA/TolQ/ExbB proton channel family protein [Myxococcaceae bacterium]